MCWRHLLAHTPASDPGRTATASRSHATAGHPVRAAAGPRPAWPRRRRRRRPGAAQERQVVAGARPEVEADAAGADGGRERLGPVGRIRPAPLAVGVRAPLVHLDRAAVHGGQRATPAAQDECGGSGGGEHPVPVDAGAELFDEAHLHVGVAGPRAWGQRDQPGDAGLGVGGQRAVVEGRPGGRGHRHLQRAEVGRALVPDERPRSSCSASAVAAGERAYPYQP